MYFLGIDQSLTSTGLAVLETGNKPVFLSNVPTGRLRGVERLAYIRNELNFVLGKYHPDRGGYIWQAAMEGYSYDSTGKVFELGEIGGILKLLLHDRNIPLIIASPSQLKKFVTGNAQAKKAAVQAGIFKKWNERIDQDDMSDAYGLAQLAKHYYANDSSFRHELEVLKAIREGKESKPSLVSRGKIKISL